MSKKKIKYSPVKEDEVIDISLALSQASALLDQAADHAIKQSDSYLLIDIAGKWIDIAKMFERDADEHIDTDTQSRQYGFSCEKEDEVNIDE
jgi:hypothetical protein